MKIRFWERVLFDKPGEGAGGTGGTGGAEGGTGGGTGGTGGTGGGTAGTGGDQLWDFADLPEGVRGATNQETFAKVKGEYFGLRQKVSAFAPPKDPNGYTFKPADKIAPFFKGGDDPMMSIARETAHKLGMPDSHFGPFINQLYTTALDKGVIPQPYNAQAEVEKIGEVVAKGLTGEERRIAITKAVEEATAFAPAFADAAKLSPTAKTLLTSLADEAGGIELIRFMKDHSGEFGIQLGGEGQNQGGYSRADYDRDVADERYSPRSAKYDKAWREQIDAKARKLFG